MPMPFSDSRSQKLIISLVLILATIVVYRPVKDAWFVDYDDNLYVTDNVRVQDGLTWKNVVWAFKTTDAANWHPLTWLSHMADCQLYGMNAAGHHFVSVIFHAANAVILFLLLNYLTGALWRSAFVAALFALHPLNVESVAWIAERKNVLSTLFWFLTIWAYALYVRKGGMKRYLMVVVLFVLGLMTKPMLVTLPCVLLLLDYWPLNRFALRSPKTQPIGEDLNQIPSQTFEIGEKKLTGKLAFRLILEKLPLLLLAIVSSAITVAAQGAGNAMKWGATLPLSIRLINATVSYGKYIYKTFYPANLTFFYPYPKGASLTYFVGIVLVLTGITLYAFLSKRRYVTVGWLWFVGTFVPVIGVIQVGGQALADRYAYIPLIGLFILVTWLAVDLISKLPMRQALLWGAGVAVILALSVVTRKQTYYWKDSITLMTRAIQVTTDNYVAYNNLGIMYSSIGAHQKALEYYELAIQSSPTFQMAYNNAAASLINMNREEEGITYLKKGLELDPKSTDSSKIYYKLALISEKKGDDQNAEEQYREAITVDHRFPLAHYQYSLLLSRQGRYDEALKQVSRALDIAPDPRAYLQLGILLEAQNKTQDAAAAYREALRLNPEDADPQRKLDELTLKSNTGAS
jgi:Tfp pilus assembly protein PilF